MFTRVKCATLVVFNQICLQFPSVAGNGSFSGRSGGSGLVWQPHGAVVPLLWASGSFYGWSRPG